MAPKKEYWNRSHHDGAVLLPDRLEAMDRALLLRAAILIRSLLDIRALLGSLGRLDILDRLIRERPVLVVKALRTLRPPV